MSSSPQCDALHSGSCEECDSPPPSNSDRCYGTCATVRRCNRKRQVSPSSFFCYQHEDQNSPVTLGMTRVEELEEMSPQKLAAIVTLQAADYPAFAFSLNSPDDWKQGGVLMYNLFPTGRLESLVYRQTVGFLTNTGEWAENKTNNTSREAATFFTAEDMKKSDGYQTTSQDDNMVVGFRFSVQQQAETKTISPIKFHVSEKMIFSHTDGMGVNLTTMMFKDAFASDAVFPFDRNMDLGVFMASVVSTLPPCFDPAFLPEPREYADQKLPPSASDRRFMLPDTLAALLDVRRRMVAPRVQPVEYRTNARHMIVAHYRKRVDNTLSNRSHLIDLASQNDGDNPDADLYAVLKPRPGIHSSGVTVNYPTFTSVGQMAHVLSSSIDGALTASDQQQLNQQSLIENDRDEKDEGRFALVELDVATNKWAAMLTFDDISVALARCDPDLHGFMSMHLEWSRHNGVSPVVMVRFPNSTQARAVTRQEIETLMCAEIKDDTTFRKLNMIKLKQTTAQKDEGLAWMDEKRKEAGQPPVPAPPRVKGKRRRRRKGPSLYLGGRLLENNTLSFAKDVEGSFQTFGTGLNNRRLYGESSMRGTTKLFGQIGVVLHQSYGFAE